MLQKLGKLVTVLWNGYFCQYIMSLGDDCIDCIKLPLFLRIFVLVFFMGKLEITTQAVWPDASTTF